MIHIVEQNDAEQTRQNMTSLNRSTLIWLNVLGLAFVLLVAAECIGSVDYDRSFLIIQIAYVYVIGFWVVGDSWHRKISINCLSGILFYTSTLFFLPYYAFKSRGKRGWLLIGLGAGLGLFYAALSVLTQILCWE